MKQWQLQEAKAKFSELVKQAMQDGPQNITVHGKPAAVVLSLEDYNKLTKSKPSFVKFMQQSPLNGIRLSVKRDKSPCREIKL
ncbi:MAG: hypothetical protein Tsb005_19110 [Gammaproteobacteria bacterium]